MAEWKIAAGGHLTQPVQDDELERLFEVDEGIPCPLGTDLLRVFAEADRRPR